VITNIQTLGRRQSWR